jgi:hypothetical protein
MIGWQNQGLLPIAGAAANGTLASVASRRDAFSVWSFSMLVRPFLRSRLALAAGLLLVATIATTLLAGQQQVGQQLFSNRAVGGVSISADGVLSTPAETDRRLLRDALVKTMKKPAGELNQPVELRMISLKGLEAAIAEAQANGMGLPDEVKYLAGLQRVQYVLLYPEENDLVLAGPGEGWKVDESGNVVGITTGLPVIQLEDLIVAFRTSEEARTKKSGGITCSIDPTEQGLRQFEQVAQAAGQMRPGVVQALEKAMGPQKISVTGVPETSHFARVLVASDYRMKRYAMELDKAPVAGLPSFIGMLKSKRAALDNMLPRWWLACNYQPLAKSEDGLVFELRGPGVKVMTESDFVEGGQVKRSGKASPVAQQWADALTSKYAALSAKDPVFGELRNVMDLCVIAALVQREDLLGQVNLQLPNILAEKDGYKLATYNAPKQVSTQCSVAKSGRDYIITASGGVDVDSWSVVENVETDAAIGKVRGKANANNAQAWWWN